MDEETIDHLLDYLSRLFRFLSYIDILMNLNCVILLLSIAGTLAYRAPSA